MMNPEVNQKSEAVVRLDNLNRLDGHSAEFLFIQTVPITACSSTETDNVASSFERNLP
jgi:hypothetical protein